MSTGILSEGDIAPPIRDVLRRQRNATVLMGDVERVDLAARSLRVRAADGKIDVPYDSLIVAAGAQQSYFGHPEFEEFAPGMKSIDDALELRAQIFGAFETGRGRGRSRPPPVVADVRRGRRRRHRRRDGRPDRRAVAPRAAPQLPADRPGGGADRPARRRADRCSPRSRTAAAAVGARRSTRMGVEMHVGRAGHGRRRDGRRRRTPTIRRSGGSRRATKIWCAGVRGVAARPHRSPRRRAPRPIAPGRVEVEPDCTLPGPPGGVRRRRPDDASTGCPGWRRSRSSRAGTPRETIRRRLDGDAARAAVPLPRPGHDGDDLAGSRVSRRSAASRRRASSAWVLWLVVHLVALTGFKNRISVLFNWTLAFLGSSRPQRVISLAELDAAAAARKPPSPSE